MGQPTDAEPCPDCNANEVKTPSEELKQNFPFFFMIKEEYEQIKNNQKPQQEIKMSLNLQRVGPTDKFIFTNQIRAVIEQNESLSLDDKADKKTLINHLSSVLYPDNNSSLLPFIAVDIDNKSKFICLIAAHSLEDANNLIAFEEMHDVFSLDKGKLKAFQTTEIYDKFLVDGKSFKQLALDSNKTQKIFENDDISHEEKIVNYIRKCQQ